MPELPNPQRPPTLERTSKTPGPAEPALPLHPLVRPSSDRRRFALRGVSLPTHRLQPVPKPHVRLSLRQTLLADLYRKTGQSDAKSFVKALLSDAGFKHTFWLRAASRARQHPWLRYTLYPLVRAAYLHAQHKHGVWIPPVTTIGEGLFLEHVGGIVVNGRAVIGKNCNLGHGVTIGQTNRGKRQGCPVIGDNVFIGPGAVIIGGVTVGDNAAIGANCLVVDDVPANAVVAAPPGQIISMKGSSGYVNRTDYPAVR